MATMFGLSEFRPHSIMASIPGFHPGDRSSILRGAIDNGLDFDIKDWKGERDVEPKRDCVGS